MFLTTYVYDRVEKAIKQDKYKIFVLRGGTRSSKTYSLMQMRFKRLMTGNIGDYYDRTGKLDIVRKYGATLRATAWLDFEEIKQSWLNDPDVTQKTKDLIKHKMITNKAEMTVKYFGRSINFMGADNWEKLKGSKRTYLYCNEASELSYKTEFYQLLMRTKSLVFIDFNPDDEEVWINGEIEQTRSQKRKDVFVDVSTYKDNKFIPQGQIEEIEYMKETDQHLRKVYGLGQYGVLQGRIFKFDIAEITNTAKFLGYGMDFGYTNDPTTRTAVYLDGKDLYFDELIYETGLRNIDISDKMEALGADKRDETIADSAEPKSIDDLCEYGWNVKPAVKGADSIRFGIDLLKKYNLYVTPGSTNIQREFKKYVWLTNKDGKALNKPVDKYNHAIDGIRYLVMHKLGQRDKTPQVL